MITVVKMKLREDASPCQVLKYIQYYVSLDLLIIS